MKHTDFGPLVVDQLLVLLLRKLDSGSVDGLVLGHAASPLDHALPD